MRTDYGARQEKRMKMRGQASSYPAIWYVALLTAPRANSDTGATISEPPGSSGYARLAVPADSSHWSDFSSTDHISDNLIDFIWTNNGPAAWTITGAALCDAATNGNCWDSQDLTTPKNVGANDTYMFNTGDFNELFN